MDVSFLTPVAVLFGLLAGIPLAVFVVYKVYSRSGA